MRENDNAPGGSPAVGHHPTATRMAHALRAARVAWALVSVFCVLCLVMGLAALPGALLWAWHLTWPAPAPWVRLASHGVAFVPAYILFACALMVLAATVTGALGWRTPRDAALDVHDWDRPLFDWVRYTVVTQIVRVFAGTFFRATPVWTMYLRLNGARVGRGVFVNTLAIMDHNLLELGDYTVIGSDVHLSGHTVEGGVLRTAAVRIGRRVTVGTQSVIGIGVEIGDDCEIGALSFVPKYARLDPGGVYAGIPVRRVSAPLSGA